MDEPSAAASPIAAAVAVPPAEVPADQQPPTNIEARTYGDTIKQEFHTLLAEFVDQLSEADFDPLCKKLLNTDNTLSGDEFVRTFRVHLLDALRADHEFFWQSSYVDDNLGFLRDVVSASRAAVAAATAEGKATPAAWRPTGKSAAEQVRFYRVFLMRAKIAYLRKQIHPMQLQNLVIKVEKHRERKEQLQLRRTALAKQIDLRLRELDASDVEIRAIAAELAEVNPAALC